MAPPSEHEITRRDFLKLSGVAALLAACGGRLPLPSLTSVPPAKDTPQPKEDPLLVGSAFMNAALHDYVNSVSAEKKTEIISTFDGATVTTVMTTENEGLTYVPQTYQAGENSFNMVSIKEQSGNMRILLSGESQAQKWSRLVNLRITSDGNVIGLDRLTNYPVLTYDGAYIKASDGSFVLNPNTLMQVSWISDNRYETVKRDLVGANNQPLIEVQVTDTIATGNGTPAINANRQEGIQSVPFPLGGQAGETLPPLDSQTVGFYLPQLKAVPLPTIVPPIPNITPPETGWSVQFDEQKKDVRAFAANDPTIVLAVATNDNDTKVWQWTKIEYVLPGVPAPSAELVKTSVVPYAKATAQEAGKVQDGLSYKQLITKEILLWSRQRRMELCFVLLIRIPDQENGYGNSVHLNDLLKD